MRCLACHGRSSPRRLWGAGVESCERCRAVWIDPFQLALLLTGSAGGAEAAVVRGELEAAKREPIAEGCPACAGEMGLQRFRTVEVARCAACGGLLVAAIELAGLRREVRRRLGAENRVVLAEILRESGVGLGYLSAIVLYLVVRPIIDAMVFARELREFLLTWLYARKTRREHSEEHGHGPGSGLASVPPPPPTNAGDGPV